jgi:iron-sulfur cluster assembly protein
MTPIKTYKPLDEQSIEPITLTEAAAQRVENNILQRGSGIGLRVAVDKKGCSGYALVVEILDEFVRDDYIFPIQKGLVVAVAKADIEFVKGTCIDYMEKGLSSGFTFSNPNQRGVCGCGESFTV